MIHIEITDGPDLNSLSAFKFFQNQIYIGKTSGDLWIKDSELLPSHILLEVIENELLIHPQKGVEFFLINGKRATQIRKLKANDVISMGNTAFKVLGFEETPKQSKKEVLNQKLNALIEQNSIRLPLIESLTKEMKS